MLLTKIVHLLRCVPKWNLPAISNPSNSLFQRRSMCTSITNVPIGVKITPRKYGDGTWLSIHEICQETSSCSTLLFAKFIPRDSLLHAILNVARLTLNALTKRFAMWTMFAWNWTAKQTVIARRNSNVKRLAAANGQFSCVPDPCSQCASDEVCNNKGSEKKPKEDTWKNCTSDQYCDLF